MPDPTQHSLPEVPDEAVEAIRSAKMPMGEKRNPLLYERIGNEARRDLERALPSLHAAWEKDFMAKLRDHTISTELLEFTRAEFEAEVKGNDSDRWFVSVMENGQIDRSWPASCEDGETPQERMMGAGVRIVAVVAEARLRDLEASPGVLSKEEARLVLQANPQPPSKREWPDEGRESRIKELNTVLQRLSDWAEERTGDGEQ